MNKAMAETVAKGAGVAKAAGARLKGLFGVFNTLASQHAEAKSLLKRLANTDDRETQVELWPTLRAELISHERAELDEVYPVLERHGMLHEFVQRHRNGAEQLEAAIGEIDAASYATPEWTTRMRALETLVVAHAKEEEEQFFPRAEHVLESEIIKDLDQRYRAAQASVKEEVP